MEFAPPASRGAGILRRLRPTGARERLEAEVRELREVLASREAMLANIQRGIVLFDGEGTRQYANAAASALLGEAWKDVDDVDHADLRAAVGRVKATGERQEGELEIAGRIIETIVTPTPPRGSILVVARDATAARRTEQLRRNFVANASHELKTPVSSIVALTAALARATGDAAATSKFVRLLGREADRLSRLVSDLLDLSRLETDAGPLGPVGLHDVVLGEVEKVRAEAAGAGLQLVVEPPPDIVVHGREPDLGLMVQNLLSNAIRYTQDGGEIRLSLVREDGTAILRVADTGIGIPAADLDRVFERFYRVDAARARETGGTGLGLAIVRHVAESHGGHVAVESRLGVGSTFTVAIPAQEG